MTKYTKNPERCKSCAYLARYYVKGATEFLPVDFGKCLKKTWADGRDFHPAPDCCEEFVPYRKEEEPQRDPIEAISEKIDAILAILQET